MPRAPSPPIARFGRRAFAILALSSLFACAEGPGTGRQRGCSGSGQRQPDTSNPVRQRQGSRMEGTELTWEELVGTEPRTFDVANPREPEADETNALSP